jgi:hypothetical protein
LTPRPARARATLRLAQIEAGLLARSILVLAGLLVGGIVVWFFTYRGQPLWWNDGWVIGYGQTVVSLMVLIAAQLATARVRRDGMVELYGSFPSSAGRRTLAHLIGVLGSVPACLVLIGAATGVFELRHSVGTPDLAVLAAGVVLVLAGGAIGVAIGTRFPHPLAGVLGAFVWFIPFTQSNRFNSAIVWLFPWVKPPQLNQLPGALSGYPPALAHTVELAAMAALAGAIALATTATARRRRVALLSAAAAALTAIVVACVVQLQPIPTRDLDHLVSEAANTGSAQHCTTHAATAASVRYCLYPGFGSRLSSLQPPVNAVLAQIPDQRARTLTISQTSGLTLDDPTLTHGHSPQQIAAWRTQLQNAPANLPSSSAIYVNLATWPAQGQANVRFDLALGAADWAVGLPTNMGARTSLQSNQCIPMNQAREPIAIWLASQAIHTKLAQLQNTTRSISGYMPVQVDGVTVLAWVYPGENATVVSLGAQTTAAGYLLAAAMANLPTQRVAAVLANGWDTWTGGHATDTQLAAALGIAMPAVPTGLVGPRGQTITPQPGTVPAQPQCPT